MQLTVIDSFTVTEEMVRRNPAITTPLGTWYVFDGWPRDQLAGPLTGTRVSIVTSSGDCFKSHLVTFEIHHSVAAAQFEGLSSILPRLSIVNFEPGQSRLCGLGKLRGKQPRVSEQRS